jgi:hypothetical protein
MRADATLDGVNAELDAIVRRNVERLPQSAAFLEASGFTARAVLLRNQRVGDLEQRLLILQGIVHGRGRTARHDGGACRLLARSSSDARGSHARVAGRVTHAASLQGSPAKLSVRARGP